MSEKVQQVGNAILTVMVQEINEMAYAGGLASDRVIEKIARAAIAAMREPTKSMLAVFADGEDPAADALNAAQLAIDEYYNGNRDFAERWLLIAYEANKVTI